MRAVLAVAGLAAAALAGAAVLGDRGSGRLGLARALVRTVPCENADQRPLPTDWRARSVIDGPVAFTTADNSPPRRPFVRDLIVIVEPGARVTMRTPGGEAALSYRGEPRDVLRLAACDGSMALRTGADGTQFRNLIVVPRRRCVPVEYAIAGRPGVVRVGIAARRRSVRRCA